jgi:hypothetical protein
MVRYYDWLVAVGKWEQRLRLLSFNRKRREDRDDQGNSQDEREYPTRRRGSLQRTA